MSILKYYLLFSLLIACNFIQANAQSVYLILNLEDGTTIQYPLEEIRKITFDEITTIKDLKKIEGTIKEFKLLQNYPNPFNPETTIQYEIPKAGKVEIKIFNINGELIKSVIQEHTQSGEYIINWNGTNTQGAVVATGIYFYQAQFENNVVSKRLIFLK